MKLLYLSIFTFILVSTCTLAISANNFFNIQKYPSNLPEVKAAETNQTLLPELVSDSTSPTFSAYAVLAEDVDSGVILFEKNPDLQLLPASTTKIITSLVALDYFLLDNILEVGNVQVEGQKMNPVPGEKITVENLLYGLLVYSANDAAEVLASNYPGGRASFITAMNLKAKEIGMTQTYFENPCGLDGINQYTTARDLVKVARVAMKNAFLRKVVSTKEKKVGSVDQKYVHNMVNINQLLGSVDGVVGIKTGWTENARENLVTYAIRNNKHIITVVLGSRNRFGETESLIEWIYSNFIWRSVDNN